MEFHNFESKIRLTVSTMSSQRISDVLEGCGYFVEDRVLGEGGYGKVKPAYSYGLRKWVAVKIIDKKKAPPGYLTTHLQREISVMCKLDHPHIVSNILTSHFLCFVYFTLLYDELLTELKSQLV